MFYNPLAENLPLADYRFGRVGFLLKEDTMRSHRILHLALLITPLLFVVGCGAHDSDEYYVFISANLDVPYWKTAGTGFTRAAAQMQLRSDFEGPQNYDVNAEKEALDRAVQKKVSGILLSVADAKVLNASINQAIAAGIPVITIDSDAPASKRLFFIGTNNYQVGVTGGQRLAQELHGRGNVVVFTMPDQPNL